MAKEDRECRQCQNLTYRRSEGASGTDACTDCTATCAPGQQIEGDCDQVALVANPLSCGSCPEGFFADGMVTNFTGFDRCVECTAGYVCPSNTSHTTYISCSGINQFMNSSGGTVCHTASVGSYTVTAAGDENKQEPHVGEVPCEPGYRCENGAKHMCNAR